MLVGENKQCSHCHQAMSFSEYSLSTFCKKQRCQRAYAQANLAKKKKIRETHYADASNRLLKLVKDLKQKQGIIAMFPANSRKLTPLPDARKKAFLSHLSALFDEVSTHSSSALEVYSKSLKVPLEENAATLLGKACATCKGYCCGLGDTHGFQDFPSLKYYLNQDPQKLSKTALLQSYEDYFPKLTYANACVFQGEQGCALPSRMRSFTCNNYLCNDLIRYQQQLVKSNSEFTYAVAIEDHKIVRASLYNAKYFVLDKLN